jgi:hypothetical protein
MTNEINPAAKPGFDRATMLAVIRAYQSGRRAGTPEMEIGRQTMATFSALHLGCRAIRLAKSCPTSSAERLASMATGFGRAASVPTLNPRREPVWDPVKGHLVPGPCPPGARDSY